MKKIVLLALIGLTAASCSIEYNIRTEPPTAEEILTGKWYVNSVEADGWYGPQGNGRISYYDDQAQGLFDFNFGDNAQIQFYTSGVGRFAQSQDHFPYELDERKFGTIQYQTPFSFEMQTSDGFLYRAHCEVLDDDHVLLYVDYIQRAPGYFSGQLVFDLSY